MLRVNTKRVCEEICTCFFAYSFAGYLDMSNKGVRSFPQVEYDATMEDMRGAFKQILHEVFKPLHRHLDCMVNNDVKRRGSTQFNSKVRSTPQG